MDNIVPRRLSDSVTFSALSTKVSLSSTIITVSIAVDLPAIAIGATSAMQTLPFTGAVVGDIVRVTAQTYLGDFVTCTGEVSAAGVVKWYVRNNSTAIVDLPLTTFNINVIKRS